MQTLKQKLSSRKFWISIATIVGGMLYMFGYADDSIESICGAITALGGAIGFMVSEGIIDAANIKVAANSTVDIFTEFVDNDEVK